MGGADLVLDLQGLRRIVCIDAEPGASCLFSGSTVAEY